MAWEMIRYFVRPEAVKREKLDVSMEFEVWTRIIKDEDGNDIQMFVKEDKRNGLRKDSSFYFDGSWEVFEFDDAVGETKFRTSWGIKSISRYDDKERLKEYYRIDAKGDTLESQKYEWKNGRLTRMAANGVVRNYIYGKTLQDTVRVVPSDEDFNYHRGYNGTTGKIPEEGTPEYEIFSLNPYGHVLFAEEGELYNINPILRKSSGSLNVFKKTYVQGCISAENKVAGMPEPRCITFIESDIIKNAATRLSGYPSQNRLPVYGRSNANLSLRFECNCDESGKYKFSFSGKIINDSIEVYLNFWRYSYEKESWYERCWDRRILPQTYRHEVQHIQNAISEANTLSSNAKTDSFNTRKECENGGEKERKNLVKKWNEWYGNEQRHANPNSPRYGGTRNEYICL